MLEKVEGIFTDPPSSFPHARPDLAAEFSPDLLTDITSHMEGYGTIKSGEYILKSLLAFVMLPILQVLGAAQGENGS